jgi:hypothetical protein
VLSNLGEWSEGSLVLRVGLEGIAEACLESSIRGMLVPFGELSRLVRVGAPGELDDPTVAAASTLP